MMNDRDFFRAFPRGFSRLLTLILVVSISLTAAAQTGPQSPKPAPSRPADEQALQDAAQVKDPEQRVDALVRTVRDFPNAVLIRNTVFYLMRPLRAMSQEPEKVRALVLRFVEGTTGATAYARSEFYNGIARNLLDQKILPSLAEDLSRKGIALLNEQDYVNNERRIHEQREFYFRQRNPDRPGESFSVTEATEKYRGFRATHYATLGRACLQLGKLEEAQAALRQAYEIKPIMEAALGLADVAEKRGKPAESFEYLADALLSGRLPAEGIERLHTVYRALHEGKLDGLESYLDEKYRKSAGSAERVEPYKPAAGRATDSKARAALAEFITGAGCEPCTAVDLAFDRELKRYDRKELILIVYHIHAPTSDPMSNDSAQARTTYYGVNSAPTIILDGHQVNAGEGLRTESDRVYRALDAMVSARVESPAEARLLVEARQEGAKLQVVATAEPFEKTSRDLRLQIALVEDEVSYSGENGLRFHPMVVRSLARPADTGSSGFGVDPLRAAKIEYTFNTDEIQAANLRYYDEYIAGMKKRIGMEPSFKEKRNVINRDRLSVVAFLQDEKSKQILQAAYFKVPGASRAASSSKDAALGKLRTLRNDPEAYVEAASRFVNDYPDAWEAESGGFWLRDAVKRAGDNPERARRLVERFIEGIAQVPPDLRVRFYSEAVRILLSRDFTSDAVALAVKGLPLLDERAYVDLERRKYERAEAIRRERTPDVKGREFAPAEQTERYRGFSAAYYSALGRAYLEQGNPAEARKSFRQAHDIKPDAESAVGLAEISQAAGKDAEAYDYMVFAALTGKLKPEEIERLHQLYRNLHQGKLDGLEEMLDRKYRDTFRNPIQPAPYRATPARTDRTVLAEMFTGGGCIPCIPVDYSFDSALAEYSRRELILLVYHMHAPVSDPLSNHSSEARQKYYQVNSAPTVYLDGAHMEIDADPRTVDLAVSKAQQVHASLTGAIRERLEIPPSGRLRIRAERLQDSVKANVTVEKPMNPGGGVTLHIALVEEEVSYSGENGLRFHPMVVRNLARPDTDSGYGFAVEGSKVRSFEYTFDLSRITAENLRYYDEYPVERRQELSARLDKDTLAMLNFTFREQKHQMNPRALAVVAFLQDNANKAILQSAYFKLESSSGKKSTKAVR